MGVISKFMSDQVFMDSLASIYGQKLANAMIKPRQLPLVPEISLYLLTDHYPKNNLDRESYESLMELPPYWAFCWGGGQAMARYILDNQCLIRGKFVIDLGAGSGVAGIAAAQAKARRVLAVDIDPVALRAVQANATLNNLELLCSTTYQPQNDSLMLAADICYEEEGMELVQKHLSEGGQLLIADSRIEQLAQKLCGVVQVAEYQVKTFPDLDEDERFNNVTLYTNL